MPERRSVEERFCQRQSCSTAPIRPQQLRRLQALWHRWTGQLELSPAADQALRHYYVRLFSQGRADQTLELTASDAEVVIQRLAKLIRWSEIKTDYAAGTAGRRGYREWRRVPPNQSAWNALWGCASALGMEPDRKSTRLNSSHIQKSRMPSSA